MDYLEQSLSELAEKYRLLQDENERLRNLLAEHNLSLPENLEASNKMNTEQPKQIIYPDISREMISHFAARFQGRLDVYAQKSKNGGYYPQCQNFWKKTVCPKVTDKKISCSTCPNRCFKPLTPDVVLNHLQGRFGPIGIYPLLPDNTCRFLVFDFDAHTEKITIDELREDVEMIRVVCKKLNIDCLVERSQSGNGAHIWILFSSPLSASKARMFGTLLLEKGIAMAPLKSYRCFDRMFPAQDEIHDNSSVSGSAGNGLGNLIALPLYGKALSQGNSAFVDEAWNPYDDQWRTLFSAKKLTEKQIDQLIMTWQQELYNSSQNPAQRIEQRIEPWKRKQKFNRDDVLGTMRIILADAIYIDTLNLLPRLQNLIRNMAALSNPEWYKNKNLKLSNWNTPRIIYTGSDENGYIRIPRGIRERLFTKLDEAGIHYEVQDKRETGRPIRIVFNGELRSEQKAACQALYHHDTGILSAATGFGKTVIAAAIMAKSKLSTLVIVENTALLDQWKKRLEEFLSVDEDFPIYTTKTGRSKQNKSNIGILKGNKNTLGGQIDLAMVQSLSSLMSKKELPFQYGLIIVDECHHAANATYREVLDKVRARYVYGFTATESRSDQLEPLEFMMIGDVAYKYSAADKARSLQLERIVIPRFTRSRILFEGLPSYYQCLEHIVHDKSRNEMIAEDVRQAIKQNRTCGVFTNLKVHAELLFHLLKDSADHVYLLYGNNSTLENSRQIEEMNEIPDQETILIIATGKIIGEGFDFPRLDTLFLTTPLSSEGPIIQTIGRIDRDYPSKADIQVYDYIDRNIPLFASQYKKRMRTYGCACYQIKQAEDLQEINRIIFSYEQFRPTFYSDLKHAKKEVIISSAWIEPPYYNNLLDFATERTDLDIIIICSSETADTDEQMSVIHEIRQCGIQIVLHNGETDNFAIIDREIVWDGGINLLGRSNAWNHIIRMRNSEVAMELLDISFEGN